MKIVEAIILLLPSALSFDKKLLFGHPLKDLNR
jgi:hypothetical protein